MKYSIIIPTYNHCDDLLKPCLDSIFKYTAMNEVELIVSANGCKDNTSQYLEDLRCRFRDIGFEKNFIVIWNDAPIGYSRANNEGIKVASGQKLLLLNNDITLLPQNKNDWINILEEQFTLNSDCGISCVLKRFSECANRHFAVFFCVMVDRKVFNTIGLLNEEYGKGGGEDTEFCIEAEKAGFTVVQAGPQVWSDEIQLYVGQYPIYHRGEGTVFDSTLVPDWQEVYYNNSVRLARKYNPTWEGLPKNDYKYDLAFLKNNIDNFYDEVVVGDEYQITTNEQMKGRNVLDIGANIGSFSILAAYLGAKRVVSVEPVASVYNMLSDNITKSNLTSILPLKNVVTDVDGDYYPIGVHDFSGVNSIYNTGNTSELVSSISLHSLLDSFDGDNIFLKCDCEGAEYDIILNASHQDMLRVNRIVLEIHMDLHPAYKGSEIIENKLKDFGFTLDTSHQIFMWDKDSQGNNINYREIPFKVQYWTRYA